MGSCSKTIVNATFGTFLAIFTSQYYQGLSMRDAEAKMLVDMMEASNIKQVPS